MWRRFFIVLAAALGVLVMVAAAAKSERVAEALRWRLEAFATDALHDTVKIGALSIGVLPPAIALEDVSVYADAAQAPWLALKHARVVPYPWPSAGGAPVLGDVELAGLVIEHTVDLSGALIPNSFAQPTQAPMQWRLPVDIYQLRLSDSDVTVRVGDRSLRLQGVSITTHAGRVHGRFVAVNINRGEIYAPGPLADAVMPFSLQGRAEIEGTFDRPRTAHIENLLAVFPGVRVNFKGDVGLEQAPTLGLQARAEADVKEACGWFPSCPNMSGHALATAKISGPAGHPDIDVVLKGTHMVLKNQRVGEVQVEAGLSARALTVDNLRIVHPEAGTLTGSGSVGLDAARSVQFSARLHDAVLPQILESCGISNAFVRMILNGDVDASGTLVPPSVALVADLESRDFQVLDHTHADADAGVLLGIGRGEIRGEVHIDNHQVTLSSVHVLSGASQLTVDGTLGYGLKAGMNLRVASDALDLRDLGPIASVPYGGQGVIAATLDGPYNDPSIASSLQATAMTIAGYTLGDTSATLIFKMPTLSLDRLTTQHGEGSLSGAGKLLFGKARLGVEGAFEADNLDLRDLLTTLSLPALARHFAATVGGRLLLAGSLAQPSGVASLKAARLLADGVSLGAMDFEASFGEPAARITGDLTLHPSRGALSAHAELHNDSTLSLGAHLDAIPLTLLTPFLNDVPLKGDLSSEVQLTGPAEALDGDISARVTDFKAYGVALGDTALHAQVQDSNLAVTGTALHGALPLTAHIGLGRKLPFEADMHGHQVPVHQLFALGDNIAVTMSGTVHASGDFTKPADFVADGQFDAVQSTWRALRLQSTTPVHLHFAGTSLTLDPLQMRGPHVGLSLGGSLITDGPMDLQLHVQGDLAVAQALNAQVVNASGPFSIAVLVGGTPAKPQITGEGDLKRGTMHLSQSEQIIDNIDTHVVFTGRSVAVQSGSANLGGGTLRFSGEAQLGGAAAGSEVNVHASLAGVELRPYPDCETTLTGDLQLVGPNNALQLKGLLHVDSLRYTARMELDRLIPKRDAAPLRVPSLQAGQVVHLGVKLQANNNIIISSTVLEAELQGDVTLTGTLEHPGLLGNITPLWARARYRDNLFKVTRASIDFIDEYRIFTEFQLQAKTTACNMQADVSIQGNSDAYTVTPYGQDEHGLVDPQDVLTCLQFGLRLHDFDGNQHNAAGFSDALPGSLDALWTVSGLDDKVRKILPISVDELRLTSGWSSLSQRTTARVLVGKELTPQVALKYSRSLDEYNDQAFSLEYKLNEKATMQGTWLSARDVPMGDFGVDLRLHWELQ